MERGCTQWHATTVRLEKFRLVQRLVDSLKRRRGIFPAVGKDKLDGEFSRLILADRACAAGSEYLDEPDGRSTFQGLDVDLGWGEPTVVDMIDLRDVRSARPQHDVLSFADGEPQVANVATEPSGRILGCFA